ncbi:MAG: acetate--CoA ligase family protein [Candidatus Paceibacterota bacterium]
MEILNFAETKKLLLKYKIPFCKTEIFNSKEKAQGFAEKIGFPVVLKVHGSTIFHKSDIGGVKTGIKNKEDFEKAWEEITENSQLKKIEGILVQETAYGNELVIGMNRDSQFGPVLMVGLGGIFVEVLKDVVFRVAPISKAEAEEMLKELKSYQLLQGFRGKPGVSIDAIATLLANISKLAMNEKKIISLDFNPIMANEKTAEVADFRLII